MTKWIILLISGALLITSVALFIEENQKESFETRGWEQATQTKDLPIDRGPLPGINVELTQYNPAEMDAQLQLIAALGFVWIRQPIYWEHVEPEPNTFDWSLYDPIIEAVANHPQLELIALLDGTPAWARAIDHPFAPPADLSQFTAFATAFAENYGNQIDYYQIWDEPNLRSHWGNIDPDPADYVAMLQEAYTAIHNADEHAHIIAAALAPPVEAEDYNEIDYLQAMYTHGAQGYFDGAAGKPYGFGVGPDDRDVGNDVFNFSRLILIREELVAHGDSDVPVWASSFGWNHLPDDWTGSPSVWGQVSADEQIRYTHKAYQRANIEWPWLAGLILQHWQPVEPVTNPIQGFAVAPHYERWIAAGPIFTANALRPGLHNVRNRFTDFNGAWQFGPLGADAEPVDPEDPTAQTMENTVTIQFYGTEFGLLIRRYDVITAYYTVTIDGDNANELPVNRQDESYIVLKAVQDGQEVEVMPIASNLAQGEHTAIITHRPHQGDDAWGLAGIAVAVAPDTTSYGRLIAYVLGAIGILGIAFSISRIPWRAYSNQTLNNLANAGIAFLLSGVVRIGNLLTWNNNFAHLLDRDSIAIMLTLVTVGLAYISPMVIITLLALAAFGVVVFNRPVMGLAAVIFWSMFFTSTLDLSIRQMTVVEVMLLISLVAISGRTLATSKTTEVFFHIHTLDLAVLAFVILSTVSITWADLRSEAIHEWRVMVLGPALFYFLVRSLPPDKRTLSLLADVVIIGGTVIALLGLRNFVSGDVIQTDGSRRLIAVYGSPNAVALQLGRCLPFAFAYAILPLGAWRRRFGIIGGLIMLIALILTQSIGSLALGIPAALAVMILAWQGSRAWKWLVTAGGIGLMILVPLSRIVPRLRNLTDLESNTTLFRLNLWRSTIEMLKDHPFTGVGLDQFLYAYRSRYILPEGSADPNLSHPHNVLLDYWVRLGILGVAVGIWLQLAFWRTAWQTYRRLRNEDPLLLALLIGTMGMMANFLAHGIIDAAYFFIHLSFLFALALGLVQRLNSVTSCQNVQ